MRDPLKVFADAMEVKLQLKDKDFPEGWGLDTPSILFEHAEKKLDYLNGALYKDHTEDIKRFSVDVANYMMMIYDKVK